MGQATREYNDRQGQDVIRRQQEAKRALRAEQAMLAAKGFPDGALIERQWAATGWWRVCAPDGSIWCETSDQAEAMERMRVGDVLYQLYEKKQSQWKYMNHKESE